MRTISALLAGVAALAPLAAAAAPPPGSIRHFRSDTVVEADGEAVQTFALEIAVNNDAAAQREAQQSVSYTEGVETVELVEGHTTKPDGRRLPVSPGAVRTQLAPGIPNVPQYASRKQVVAVLPDVAGGDVLGLTWRRAIRHPVFPGHFTATYVFTRAAAWDDAEVSVSVPDGVTLNTESHGPEGGEAEEGGRRVYRWHWSAPALASDPAVLSPLDRSPRLFVSTFPDWAAFSRAYAGLTAPKAAVTPRIQALADQVAAGAADRREEARQIYEWVSRHIRWVAIYVGDGAFMPHPADEVLANGYGDCKDQVMLLVALLRARGIAAEPVLVNLGPTYRLSGPPTLSAFNHVVTFVPERHLYVDTTAGGAPFGTLPAQEYGKPILHLTEAGTAPGRMAVLPPDAASERLTTTMRMQPDGRITGESVTEATGAYVMFLRHAAQGAMAQGGERAAAERLLALGEPGEGEIAPTPLDPITPDYRVSARFTLDPRPNWLEGDSFAVPQGMRLLSEPGDGLLGPLAMRNLPAGEPTPCYAGRQEEEVSLALPPGYRLARLPKERRIEGDAFTYQSRWSQDEGVLRISRRLTSRVDRPLCEGPLRAAAAKAMEEIRRDYDFRVEAEKAD